MGRLLCALVSLDFTGLFPTSGPVACLFSCQSTAKVEVLTSFIAVSVTFCGGAQEESEKEKTMSRINVRFIILITPDGAIPSLAGIEFSISTKSF